MPTPTIFALVPTLTATPPPDAGGRISLEVENRALQVGEEFRVVVRVWASAPSPVDAVQVYLDFDPEKLEVVALSPGSQLKYELQSAWNNGAGNLRYAAGTVSDAVASPFTLCTATFRVKARTEQDGTPIRFAALEAPRETKVVARGANVTGELVPASIVVR